MNKWLSIPPKERINIINSIGYSAGIRVEAIEKDWWVTEVLKAVFTSKLKDYIIFKGGTSLSKGWGLIKRFSEDIDLAINRDFLGFKDDLGSSQREKLRRKSVSFIKEEFVVVIEEKLNEHGHENFQIILHEDCKSVQDPCRIDIKYNSDYEKGDAGYLKENVLIEIGCRSLKEPSEMVRINSIIGEHEIEFKENFGVMSVLPKRTFLEKAFLLHEYFQREDELPERMSRHLYDLGALMDTDHGKEALEDKELYLDIISHRERFTKISGLDYSLHMPNTIDFLPPSEKIPELEADYAQMVENMIYEEDPKSFEDLLKRIEQLKDRFRKVTF